jgi:fido (protein-threonine AMPylation protein)
VHDRFPSRDLSVEDTLRYDFAQEQGFAYAGLSAVDVAHHIARFVSGVWQIHPFGEGNTRTTAVFAIKYLRTMGNEVNNGPFQDHSWYFRNALVRANYEDVTRGIAPTMTYLERFFQNLLCGTRHELKNRYLHLEWPQQESDQNDQPTPPSHPPTPSASRRLAQQVAF